MHETTWLIHSVLENDLNDCTETGFQKLEVFRNQQIACQLIKEALFTQIKGHNNKNVKKSMQKIMRHLNFFSQQMQFCDQSVLRSCFESIADKKSFDIPVAMISKHNSGPPSASPRHSSARRLNKLASEELLTPSNRLSAAKVTEEIQQNNYPFVRKTTMTSNCSHKDITVE